jgi:chromate transport protein ChrA
LVDFIKTTQIRISILYIAVYESISKMNKKRLAMSITAGIAVMLLLIEGPGATSILIITHAQSATLGEPFFVENA